MHPPSQKHRPISFRLDGGGASERVDLVIRPEDLTRQEPSRLTVTQTLGGAFVDAFGRGVSTITLAGHLGWRGSYLLSGEDLFHRLRSAAFEGWHARRLALEEAGQDPAQVQLFFVDTLDRITAEVAPRTFSLRRSKTSPLLMRYQIVLVVLDDSTDRRSVLDRITEALSDPVRWVAGVLGLDNLLGVLDGYARGAVQVLGAARAGMRSFSGVIHAVLAMVRDVAREGRGVFEDANSLLYSTGLAATAAGRNAAHALAADPALPPAQRYELMRLGAAYGDAYCTLSNSFTPGRYFRSYEELLGASNCSSTGGGHAWSPYVRDGINPFAEMMPPTPSPVSVTTEARQALAELQGDPMTLVGQQERVGALLASAAQGITVA